MVRVSRSRGCENGRRGHILVAQLGTPGLQQHVSATYMNNSLSNFFILIFLRESVILSLVYVQRGFAEYLF